MKPLSQTIAFSFFLLFAFNAVAEVKTLSVEEFEKAKASWPQMVGKELRIEGRYSFVARETMKFIGTDMTFVLTDDITRPQKNTRTVQVTGRMDRVNGKPTFRVTRLRTRPSDLEFVRQRMRVLPADDIDAMHELGEWAAQRGKFYDDVDLKDLANEIHLKGIRSAKAGTAADDGQAMLALAAKVAEYELGESLRREYVHDGLRRFWKKQVKDPKSDLKTFLKTVNTALPASQFPLPETDPATIQDYKKQPTDAYRKAEPKLRNRFDRLFHQEIARTHISRLDEEDGSNAAAMAELSSSLIPEDKSLRQTFLDRHVEYLRAGIKTATRQQAQSLAKLYEARKQPEDARKSLQEWLAARKNRIQDGNVSDLFAVSDDYVTLLNDRQGAAKLLFEVQEKNPEMPELAERFQKLGYVEVEGEWITKAKADKLPKDPIQEAMKRGDVTRGMTREQVFKTLGNPTSSSRFVSRDGFTEVWTYADARIVVRFEKQNRTTDAAVDNISALKSSKK